MARFRLSRLAEADLADILATSGERWGSEGRRRYAAILGAAMRKVAADPHGLATRDRADVLPGMRSLHLRLVHGEPAAHVPRPVHVLYYRAAAPGLIAPGLIAPGLVEPGLVEPGLVEPGLVEIVRVLHERMEPRRHLDALSDEA